MMFKDYQNTQSWFKLDYNFKILTPTFKDIEMHPLSMPITLRISK